MAATLAPPRGRSARSLLWPLGALACLALLLIAQRAALALPATATSPLVPLARLFDLALLALALALGHAAGARALRALGLRVRPVEGAAFGTALGLGLLAYAALALGLLGLYRPPVLLAGALLALAALRRDLAATWAGLVASGRSLRGAAQGLGPGRATLAALLTLCAILATLGALTPPHHFDPLSYHLAAPQRFLATGRVAPLADVEFANLPLTMELLYGVGLAFGSETFGQLLHLAFAGITAAALWALARRSFDRATAWLALAVFLGTPLVVVWARVADIDLAVSCFLFLATAAALRAAGCLEEAGGAGARPWLRGGEGVERALRPGERWASEGGGAHDTLNVERALRPNERPSDVRRWLLLAGVFAGLALGTKYQALFAVPLLAAVVLVDGWRRRGARAALADAGVLGGAAALVAAPWYLKNWLLLGNPVWPLFFGGRGFGPLALELSNYFAAGMTISPRTPLGYLALPLRAYTHGDIEQRLVVLSPLYLLLPALLWLPRRRELLYLLIPSLGLAVGWALGFQELRYLLPVCAPLSLATAYALRAALARPRLGRLVQPALLGSALLCLALVGLHVGADRPLGVLLGRESHDAYLRQSVTTGPSYRATSFLAGRLRPGETVRFFDEAQVFYVPFAVQPDQLDINLLALTEAHPDPADALATLRAEGVDYLLVNAANIRYRRRFDPAGRLARGEAVLARFAPSMELVYRDGPADRPSIVIYRVSPAAGVADGAVARPGN